MAYDPRLRASDQDRDRAASMLREHHAAGRLTAEEFNERLDRAFEAKTVGELDELLADLPKIDLFRLPDAELTRQSQQAQLHAAASQLAAAQARFSPAWRAAAASWFTASLICFVVWALSGFGYPWPLWVAGPWGAILLGRWVTGSHPSGSRRAGPGPGGIGRVNRGIGEPGQIAPGSSARGGQGGQGEGDLWGDQDETGRPPGEPPR
jgi:hypothetical protein